MYDSIPAAPPATLVKEVLGIPNERLTAPAIHSPACPKGKGLGRLMDFRPYGLGAAAIVPAAPGPTFLFNLQTLRL